MKKIVLNDDITSALNFLIKVAEMYFGAVNASKTYLPYVEKILNAQEDDVSDCQKTN